MHDIQTSIEKLNISSSDKDKMKSEIDTLNKEQRDLLKKIEDLDRDNDDAKHKTHLLIRR